MKSALKRLSLKNTNPSLQVEDYNSGWGADASSPLALPGFLAFLPSVMHPGASFRAGPFADWAFLLQGWLSGEEQGKYPIPLLSSHLVNGDRGGAQSIAPALEKSRWQTRGPPALPPPLCQNLWVKSLAEMPPCHLRVQSTWKRARWEGKGRYSPAGEEGLPGPPSWLFPNQGKGRLCLGLRQEVRRGSEGWGSV